MSQYFENNDSLERETREITCWCGTRKLSFITDRGVFSRTEIDDASLFLVRNIPEITGRVLDLGCGYGFIGIYTAVRNPLISLVQCDVNERAVELCRLNCEANGISSHAVVSDGLASLDGSFDCILLNPPIHAGKEVSYRLAEESMEHLSNDGRLYIVIRTKHGAQSMIEHLSAVSDVRILRKEKGIFILSCSRKEEDY